MVTNHENSNNYIEHFYRLNAFKRAWSMNFTSTYLSTYSLDKLQSEMNCFFVFVFFLIASNRNTNHFVVNWQLRANIL